MGLDMYLGGAIATEGKCGVWEYRNACGFADWRKHWNLHAYLLERFAGGMADYNQSHMIEVQFSADNLRAIISACEVGEVKPQPVPAGVTVPDDAAIFRRALKWLDEASYPGERAIFYGAND